MNCFGHLWFQYRQFSLVSLGCLINFLQKLQQKFYRPLQWSDTLVSFIYQQFSLHVNSSSLARKSRSLNRSCIWLKPVHYESQPLTSLSVPNLHPSHKRIKVFSPKNTCLNKYERIKALCFKCQVTWPDLFYIEECKLLFGYLFSGGVCKSECWNEI